MLELLIKTLDALRAERGEDYLVHGSRVKQTIKRQHPASTNALMVFAPSAISFWKRKNADY